MDTLVLVNNTHHSISLSDEVIAAISQDNRCRDDLADDWETRTDPTIIGLYLKMGENHFGCELSLMRVTVEHSALPIDAWYYFSIDFDYERGSEYVRVVENEPRLDLIKQLLTSDYDDKLERINTIVNMQRPKLRLERNPMRF